MEVLFREFLDGRDGRVCRRSLDLDLYDGQNDLHRLGSRLSRRPRFSRGLSPDPGGGSVEGRRVLSQVQLHLRGPVRLHIIIIII